MRERVRVKTELPPGLLEALVALTGGEDLPEDVDDFLSCGSDGLRGERRALEALDELARRPG